MATPSKKMGAARLVAVPPQRKPRLRSLVQQERDLVALVDAQGIVTYLSPAVAPMLGYAPEAIVGTHLSTLALPDDSEALRKMFGDALRAPNKQLSGSYRLRAKDGFTRWVKAHSTNLLQTPGVGAVVVHFHEIPQRQLAPRSSRRKVRATEHFVQFYESDAFLLERLSDFVGMGLQSGGVCLVVATQAHRDGLEARLRARGLNLAAARTNKTYVALDADETLAQFMVNEQPDPERFNAVVGALIARAARKRRPVRAFGEMVARLWAANNQAAAIRLEELWNDLAQRSASLALFCAYAMPNLIGEENEAWFNSICQQHARVIPTESYTTLARLDERLRAISILQQKANSLQAEIAERKAAQQRALEALEETTRQMETFVSIVSHELRTPITSLKTSIQLARRRMAQEPRPGSPSPAALLERTETQIRRLTRLIDDLLDLSRVSSGRLELRETWCDLGQVMQKLVESERLAHPNRLIQFEPPAAPLLVRGDPDRLEQVGVNYLANALKYAPVDRPIIVRVERKDAQVQVSVEDQGPGIPTEEQERIWDMFYRAPGIGVQNGSGIGLGLGLHLSKMMIEQQGGQVGVKSEDGQGSVFWFALSLAEPPSAENSLALHEL